jgi:hypothetical protein
MSQLDEQLSAEFHRWEQRGRGWQVFSEPVQPEPAFVPFNGHYLPATAPIDDGARPTFLSSLVQKVSRRLSTETVAPPAISEPEEEPEPTALIRESLVELQASLPDKLDISKETFEQFLLNLSLCREPMAFELLGTHKKVAAQFVASKGDAPLPQRPVRRGDKVRALPPRGSTSKGDQRLWLVNAIHKAKKTADLVLLDAAKTETQTVALSVPRTPIGFFSQDRQFDRQIRQGPFLLLEFVLDGVEGLRADLALLVPGFGAEPLERPFLDLLTDAGQIGRVEAFAAQQLAHGFVAVLSLQIDLELFLGSQKPPLLLGTLVRFYGWVATHHVSVSVLSHQG